MREVPWSLFLGVIMAAMMALPALAGRLSYDDDSYVTGERGRRDETENQMYEDVSKRALIALSRFKPFASALSPDFHRYVVAPAPFDENLSGKAFSASRYAARSYVAGRDSMTVEERRGRPAQNPMRFGR